MAEGRVLYADHDHVHVLRYVGDIRHPLAPSVSGFVDKLLEHLDGDDLVFDLSEADAIDSTNLGEIARIADRLSARDGKRAAIISTRPEISRVLFSMAFDEVFDICTDDPGKSPTGESAGAKGGQPIPNLPASRDLSLRVILSAHRRLMQMSESNRTQFREVVEMMERELGSPAAEPNDAARD
jgi:anti-anti-sigma factor